MEVNRSSSPSPAQNPLQPIYELLHGGDPDAVCSKYGLTREELDKLVADYQKSMRQAALADQLAARGVGRNEPCPCGSGKKYKKCCLPLHEEARMNMSQDALAEMEERARIEELLKSEVQKGFEYLVQRDYTRAQRLAERLIEKYPEDDRLHDILVSSWVAQGDYDRAFHRSRQRWQVAEEERIYYQENGYHKREGEDRKQLVHFYAPSTWLEQFWIMQRARTYREMYPCEGSSPLKGLVEKLRAANDMNRFPARQEQGFEMRRRALAPAIDELKNAGPAAIPYVLPLAYQFSWASLFVPEIIADSGSDKRLRLLAEMSMFRFPYFAQSCLKFLETAGESAVPDIDAVLRENPAFDELKVGLLMVLGDIPTPESFKILVRFTEHRNPYLVNWAAKALERHNNPEAAPYLEKARERSGDLSKIAGAVQDLAPIRNG